MSDRRSLRSLGVESLDQRVLLTTLSLVSPAPMLELAGEIASPRPQGLNLEALASGTTLSQDAVDAIISEFVTSVGTGNGPLSVSVPVDDNDLLPGEYPGEEPLPPTGQLAGGTSAESASQSPQGEQPTTGESTDMRPRGGGVWILTGGGDTSDEDSGHLTEEDLLPEDAGPQPFTLKVENGRPVGFRVTVDGVDYLIFITYHPNGQPATATVDRTSHDDSDEDGNDESDDGVEKPDGRVEWNDSGQRTDFSGDVEYVDIVTRSLETTYPVD